MDEAVLHAAPSEEVALAAVEQAVPHAEDAVDGASQQGQDVQDVRQVEEVVLGTTTPTGDAVEGQQ